MELVLTLLVGFTGGLAAAYALKIFRARSAEEIAREVYIKNESLRQGQIESIIGNLEKSFGNLSANALKVSSEEFIKLAETKLAGQKKEHVEALEGKKGLIDQQLHQMTERLKDVTQLMQTLEKDREGKFKELAAQLKTTGEQTAALAKTTGSLREVLASSKARGQWGERMAEDILRFAGLIENVNYIKQKAVSSSRSIPDFTFLLPRDLRINMDVKFPYDNYVRSIEAGTDTEKSKYRADFLRDVRLKVKEVSTRDYVNTEQNTVDYALLFIPNEQIHAFIQESDPELLPEALKNKVVICSPITLYAVLVVIRQAVDGFALERTSHEILKLLGSFKLEWQNFIDKMDRLGKYLTTAQDEYDALVTTRRRQLEKPLEKLETLRTQRGLELLPGETESSIRVLPTATAKGP